MNRFQIAFSSSSCNQNEPRQQLLDAASSTIFSVAAYQIFETPYAFLLCYLVTADHTIGYLEKRAVKNRSIKHFPQWYLFECAFFVLISRVVMLTDSFLFPERKSHVVSVFQLLYLIKRAAVAWQLHQGRKLF